MSLKRRQARAQIFLASRKSSLPAGNEIAGLVSSASSELSITDTRIGSRSGKTGLGLRTGGVSSEDPKGFYVATLCDVLAGGEFSCRYGPGGGRLGYGIFVGEISLQVLQFTLAAWSKYDMTKLSELAVRSGGQAVNSLQQFQLRLALQVDSKGRRRTWRGTAGAAGAVSVVSYSGQVLRPSNEEMAIVFRALRPGFSGHVRADDSGYMGLSRSIGRGEWFESALTRRRLWKGTGGSQRQADPFGLLFFSFFSFQDLQVNLFSILIEDAGAWTAVARV